MIVAGIAVAWSGQQAVLATVVVLTAVYFSFAMTGLEVARLVAAAYVVSALSLSRTLFSLWSVSCCATEHIIGFYIPIREALDRVYASFAMAWLEGAQPVAAAYM